MIRDSKHMIGIANAIATTEDEIKIRPSLYEDACHALFRMALLAESLSNIHIQLLFHSILNTFTAIMMSSTEESSFTNNSLDLSQSSLVNGSSKFSSTSTVSSLQILENKTKAINNICDLYEKKSKVSITQILNSLSPILSDESKIFNESIKSINAYTDKVLKTQLFISTNLIVFMITIALVMFYLLLILNIPYDKRPKLLEKFHYFMSSCIDESNAFPWLLYCLIFQIINVVLILSLGGLGKFIRSAQYKILHQAIIEARDRMFISRVLTLDTSSSRKSRFDIPIGAVIPYAGSVDPKDISALKSSSPTRYASPGKHSQSTALSRKTISSETSVGLTDELTDYWLPCDGREVSIAEYPELFHVLQGMYGKVSGGTFRLPDYRGCLMKGLDTNETAEDMGSFVPLDSTMMLNSASSESSLPSEKKKSDMKVKSSNIPLSDIKKTDIKAAPVNYLIRVRP